MAGGDVLGPSLASIPERYQLVYRYLHVYYLLLQESEQRPAQESDQ